MKQQIETFIDELKSKKKISTFDEASIKQAVVLRLLSFLGWDIFDVEEVYPWNLGTLLTELTNLLIEVRFLSTLDFLIGNYLGYAAMRN